MGIILDFYLPRNKKKQSDLWSVRTVVFLGTLFKTVIILFQNLAQSRGDCPAWDSVIFYSCIPRQNKPFLFSVNISEVLVKIKITKIMSAPRC